ncbi:glucose-1-phosphate adenylyltransferase [Psychromicrobium sp. YIM B11713]|uniref:glucose-1-phosphate adenylyltransferase n=1 Tax=Psychromicrobium sp. YIM B11713 TaxID=3145233 RepID=UPI00374E2315
MAVTKVLAIVLAGGEGNRLMPLTTDRAKPAVPFAGGYRLIDFALSNLVNSGYRQIVVLTQYKSHSLDRHISETWRMSNLLGNYVASVPAQQRVGKSWFLGSANAIYQSLNLIHDAQPDYVVVVGADHVYRMDFSQMVQAHIASGLAVTVAGVRQPLEFAPSFGVIESDPSDAGKIKAFVEKPATTPGLEEDPTQFLASMGNYVFTTADLLAALDHDAEQLDTKHDMGGDIIPYFVERGEAGVYDFNHNDIPGATDRDRYYWRDVGTLDSYFDAQMDLISPLPVFNLYNLEWPIYTRQSISPPAKLVRGESSPGTAEDSIVSNGVVISGGTVTGSVLGHDVYIAEGAVVEDSVLMDKVTIGPGAVVRKAILDKNVRVPAGATIGVDPVQDAAQGFRVTESGITVLSKGQVVPVPVVPVTEPKPKETAAVTAAAGSRAVPDAVAEGGSAGTTSSASKVDG